MLNKAIKSNSTFPSAFPLVKDRKKCKPPSGLFAPGVRDSSKYNMTQLFFFSEIGFLE